MSVGKKGMKKLMHLLEHAGNCAHFPVSQVVQVKYYWKGCVQILIKARKQPVTQRRLKADISLFTEMHCHFQWPTSNILCFIITLQTLGWHLQTSQGKGWGSWHFCDNSAAASLLFQWKLSYNFGSCRLVSIRCLFRSFLFSKFVLCSYSETNKGRCVQFHKMFSYNISPLFWIIEY